MTTAPPAERTAQTTARTTSSGDAQFETHGGALVNVLRASGAVADFARAGIQAAGVSLQGAAGDVVIPDWFPLQANLQVLDEIAGAFGDDALFDIGFTVRDHARFPPEIRDLGGALATLDVAFHLNHRRNGTIMYDPTTGAMLDGIGHYRFDEADAIVVGCSTSVYPCSFDLGVIAGVSARFDDRAIVQHSSDGSCRRRGGESCGYLVRRHRPAAPNP